MQDRPASLARKPKPPRDANIDPMEYRGEAPKLQAVPAEEAPAAPAAEPEPQQQPQQQPEAQQVPVQPQFQQQAPAAAAMPTQQPQAAPSAAYAPPATAPAAPAAQAPAQQGFPSAPYPGYKPSPGPGRRRGEPTIPISPRISIPAFQMLDAAIREEGITQREAIEQAIFARWSQYAES